MKLKRPRVISVSQCNRASFVLFVLCLSSQFVFEMSTDSACIDASQPINFNVITYSKPKTVNKAVVININNIETKKYFTFATPLMMTWGAQEGMSEDSRTGEKIPTGKWAASFQFPASAYATPETEMFKQNMQGLWQKVRNDAFKNAPEWIGKNVSGDYLDDAINPILRYPKDKETKKIDYTKEPTISTKFPFWKDRWATEVFDFDGNPLFVAGHVNADMRPMDFVPKMAQVIGMVQCGGIWIVDKKLSIVFNLMQIIVKPTSTERVVGKCMLAVPGTGAGTHLDNAELPDAEHHEDDDAAHVVTSSAPRASTTAVIVDDDEDDVPAPAPAPTPAPASVPEPAPVTEPEPVAAAAPADPPKKKMMIKKAKAT